MEYLHILKIGYNSKPCRVEVAVIGQEVIHGVKCFFHSDGKRFYVSHLDSGCLIAAANNMESAINLAHHLLSDYEKLSNKIKEIESFILDLGVLYPINPVPS